MLTYAKRDFVRIVAIIDHPISAWGPVTDGEYLSCTFNLLDHLNRMSSAISLLGHTRVSLAHSLSISESSPSVVAVKRLKGITAHASGNYGGNVGRRGEDGRGRTGTGKDWAILMALNITKGIEFWVSGFMISALSGDAIPYLEMGRAGVMKPKWCWADWMGLRSQIEGLRKEVNFVFYEVMFSRNTLLVCLRAAHCQM